MTNSEQHGAQTGLTLAENVDSLNIRISRAKKDKAEKHITAIHCELALAHDVHTSPIEVKVLFYRNIREY